MYINEKGQPDGLIKQKRNAGFTLIEIMVSLLVLSIGLLGMMALQNVALRHNQSAYYNSQAAFLANDILDRIRANKNTGAYAINLGDPTPTATQNCESLVCNGGQMATWDLNQWRTAVTVTSNMPSARSAVAFVGVPGGTEVIITIEYDDRRDPNDPNLPQYTLQTRL